MSTGSESSGLASVTARVFQEVGGWMLIVIGVIIVVSAVGNLAGALSAGEFFLGNVVAMTLALVVALLFTLAGATVAPSVRKRVDNRHSLSEFGRTPVVENRVIRPEEHCIEQCVVCNGSVDAGLVRRYREDITVAGIPLVFGSNSYNHYCLDCAREEMGLTEPAHIVDASERTSREPDDDGGKRELEPE